MHSKRGRPTLRLLREDILDDWFDPSAKRALADERLRDLMPLSELPHPIIQKASEAFSDDPEQDNFIGKISCSTNIGLLEIKTGQWRGGVWEDPETGVRWLVVAGYAKGNHKDNEDFYQKVARHNDSEAYRQWFPSERDYKLLKLETAARIRTEWELDIQNRVAFALGKAESDGESEFSVPHPKNEVLDFAEVRFYLEKVRGDDQAERDELLVELIPNRGEFFHEELYWVLIKRVLVSIVPPVDGWDRYKDTFSNYLEPGECRERKEALESLNAEKLLQSPQLGQLGHYAHRKHIAECSIEGRALRSLCGTYFVPAQDPDKFPKCPECEEMHSKLPE